MLDLTEIEKEIKCLEEHGCTTYSVCNKLAILYIVRDHYKNTMDEPISKMTVPAKSI